MKVSIMAWPLFWYAFDGQNPAALDGWVERWKFADDGVRALMAPQPSKGRFMMRPKREHTPGSFSIVPLLLAEAEIPAAVRQALAENRLEDAAELLMREYGLSCIEAGDLLDVSAC